MNDQQSLDQTRVGRRLSIMNTTYRLLIRSNEPGRNIMETAIYVLLGACVLVSIVQFAQQPSKLPHLSQHALEHVLGT